MGWRWFWPLLAQVHGSNLVPSRPRKRAFWQYQRSIIKHYSQFWTISEPFQVKLLSIHWPSITIEPWPFLPLDAFSLLHQTKHVTYDGSSWKVEPWCHQHFTSCFSCDFTRAPQEQVDGEATVTWMRRQPWCNGKVGVTGASCELWWAPSWTWVISGSWVDNQTMMTTNHSEYN